MSLSLILFMFTFILVRYGWVENFIDTASKWTSKGKICLCLSLERLHAAHTSYPLNLNFFLITCSQIDSYLMANISISLSSEKVLIMHNIKFCHLLETNKMNWKVCQICVFRFEYLEVIELSVWFVGYRNNLCWVKLMWVKGFLSSFQLVVYSFQVYFGHWAFPLTFMQRKW